MLLILDRDPLPTKAIRPVGGMVAGGPSCRNKNPREQHIDIFPRGLLTAQGHRLVLVLTINSILHV